MPRIVLVYKRWSMNIYWKKKGRKEEKLTTIKYHLSRGKISGHFKSLDHGHVPTNNWKRCWEGNRVVTKPTKDFIFREPLMYALPLNSIYCHVPFPKVNLLVSQLRKDWNNKIWSDSSWQLEETISVPFLELNNYDNIRVWVKLS